MADYYDMCIRTPRDAAALIEELIAAATDVVEDNNFLRDKRPNATDSYGINARKLWRLKQAIPK